MGVIAVLSQNQSFPERRKDRVARGTMGWAGNLQLLSIQSMEVQCLYFSPDTGVSVFILKREEILFLKIKTLLLA